MSASSTEGIKIVLHPVSDLKAAKSFYTALLGTPPQADSPYYVGFDAAGQHIGLLPAGGPQGMTSPVAYWQVPDIEAKLAEVIAAGAAVKEPVRDVGEADWWRASATRTAMCSACSRTPECARPSNQAAALQACDGYRLARARTVFSTRAAVARSSASRSPQSR